MPATIEDLEMIILKKERINWKDRLQSAKNRGVARFEAAIPGILSTALLGAAIGCGLYGQEYSSEIIGYKDSVAAINEVLTFFNTIEGYSLDQISDVNLMPAVDKLLAESYLDITNSIQEAAALNHPEEGSAILDELSETKGFFQAGDLGKIIDYLSGLKSRISDIPSTFKSEVLLGISAIGGTVGCFCEFFSVLHYRDEVYLTNVNYMKESLAETRDERYQEIRLQGYNHPLLDEICKAARNLPLDSDIDLRDFSDRVKLMLRRGDEHYKPLIDFIGEIDPRTAAYVSQEKYFDLFDRLQGKSYVFEGEEKDLQGTLISMLSKGLFSDSQCEALEGSERFTLHGSLFNIIDNFDITSRQFDQLVVLNDYMRGRVTDDEMSSVLSHIHENKLLGEDDFSEVNYTPLTEYLNSLVPAGEIDVDLFSRGMIDFFEFNTSLKVPRGSKIKKKIEDGSFNHEHINAAVKLHSLSSDAFKLYNDISDDYVLGEDDIAAFEAIFANGFTFTPYLLEEYKKSKNRSQTIAEWQEVRKSISQGNFKRDRLHSNIAYSQLDDFDGAIRVPDINFFETQMMFGPSPMDFDKKEDKTVLKEIDYLCHEASHIFDTVMRIKKSSGRNVVVVPNMRYGGMAVTPIIDELDEQGVEIMQKKIGSSYSRGDLKNLIRDLLDESQVERMVTDQPIYVVVDGTYNDHAYPASMNGYLSYMLMMNDVIKGQKPTKHSGNVKVRRKHLKELANSYKYSEAKKHIYNLKLDFDPNQLQPYSFHVWNSYGKKLGIPIDSKKAKTCDPDKMSGPAIVFLDASIPDNEVPRELRSEIGSHQKGHFDDKDSYFNTPYYRMSSHGPLLVPPFHENAARLYAEKHRCN